MRLQLNPKNRKFIEIPIEDENGKEIGKLTYFERNTKQIKAIKKASKVKTVMEIDELNQKQFFDNLQGGQELKDKIVAYYEEYGNIVDFINDCDEALGKQKRKG